MFRTLLQETYKVLDALFYDDGVSGYDVDPYFDNTGMIDKEITPQGTVLQSNSSTKSANQLPNKNGTSTGTLANVQDWTPPFVFEVTVVSSQNLQSTLAVSTSTTSSRNLSQLGLSVVDNNHIRVVVADNMVKYYVDGELKVTKQDMDTSSNSWCLIQCNATDTLVIKDIKIYPI